MFLECHPILGTRDLERTVEFYVERLGFELAFRDRSDPTNYAGLRRDAVEIHFQWQDESEMVGTRLRVMVADPDALHAEYESKQVFHSQTTLANTPWGTREFAFYDPDMNALTFYRDLRPGETE